MNKQSSDGIPYCDYTWNPITGCLHGCPYCYARGIANRFQGGFAPAFHPKRLDEPKRVHTPATIFGGDMGDMFGDWLKRQQIQSVLDVIRDTPWHRYLLLTKNPKRYQEFEVPRNAWIGTTVEDDSERWRVDELLKAKASLYFVSAEPLLGRLHLAEYFGKDGVGWVIVGAQSGANAIDMDEDWVRILRDDCRRAQVPFFYKQNVVNRQRIRLPLLGGISYRQTPALQ